MRARFGLTSQMQGEGCRGPRKGRFTSMSQVTVTLPDGSQRTLPAGSPVRDVAEGISPRLAQAALAGVVDGKLVDLGSRLDADASVRIVTDKSPEALALYRHSKIGRASCRERSVV